MDYRQTPIEIAVRLRARNQLTLPKAIARALRAQQDDILVFRVDPTLPETTLARRAAPGFAGALTGIYGTTQDVKVFIAEEHAAWD